MKFVLILALAFTSGVTGAIAKEKQVYCGGNVDGNQLEISVFDGNEATLRYVYPDGTNGEKVLYPRKRNAKFGYTEFYNEESWLRIDARLLAGDVNFAAVTEGRPEEDHLFKTCFTLN